MTLEVLDVAEIERCIEATECSPLLVAPRLLRRVIKHHKRLPGVGFDVPHAFAYVLPKADLLAIAEEVELGRAASALPDPVILLPRPEADVTADRDDTVVSLWRGAFHASVHREIERKIAGGILNEATIRGRIHAVGQTEFDEIRLVLRQDDALLPPDDDVATYTEFVATYLELREFAPHTIQQFFPALGNFPNVDRTIELDVDAGALLMRSRPVNAPDDAEIKKKLAPLREETASLPGRKSEPHSSPARVSPAADKARAVGNTVRSILLRVRLRGTEGAVWFDLSELMNRVARALQWEGAPIEEWAKAILPIAHLAPAAHQLPWNTEARILYDLQKLCVDAERELYTLSVVDWALALGKTPIKRPLPAQREVRIVKHLDAAIAKLPRAALGEPARGSVTRLLRAWRSRAETNVRTSLAPRIEAALDEVGLVPSDVPGHVSRKKLVLELLDQIVEHGQISLSQLRDSVSRNNVKMGNLTLGELAKGDALLQADKILSKSIDGVYRRGEVYLRGLQKLSSTFFGTPFGRFLTLFALLPFAGAYVVLSGLQHTVGLVLHSVFGFGEVQYVQPIPLAVLAIFIFIGVHSVGARVTLFLLLRLSLRPLRSAFVDFPVWLFTHPLVVAFRKLPPVRFVARFLLKPAIIAAFFSWPVIVFDRHTIPIVVTTAVFFVVSNVVLNSSWGRHVEEAAADWVAGRWRQVKKRVLPGLFALIIDFFRRSVELLERFIYTVDELLRFRQGDGQMSLVVKASVGVIWFFVTYFIRIYVNLLIEPEMNPIKHVPTVTVAAKIMVPFTGQIHEALALPLRRLFGTFVTEPIVAITIFVLPGFFGFLVWELKENWRLYSANRAPALAPVVIGHHGETMSGFMKPGFHSGTIPKIYAKLRRATAKRSSAAFKHREALHHTEESIRCFFERELVPLLGETTVWTGGPVRVGHVDVASNRVRVEIVCPEVGGSSMRIAFEEQSGWLLGSIVERGFVDRLDPGQRVVFENALAGLYKMAGVEIVREQVASVFGTLPYDVSDAGLVVWPDRSYRSAVVYDLKARGHMLPATIRVGLGVLPPAIEAGRVLFRSEKILWTSWVEAWAPKNGVPPRLVKGPSLYGSPPPVAALRSAS